MSLTRLALRGNGTLPASRRITALYVRFNSTKVSNDLFPSLSSVRPDELLTERRRFDQGTYFVERSSTGNLPVYSDFRAGRNKVVTEIRKIRGNVVQLRNDLQEMLPEIPKKSWRILPQSHKIIIDGNVVKAVKRVLGESF